MNKHGSLILIRGLPGAGKTTFATLLSEEGKYPVFSVDDYFTAEDGSYEFRFAENHLAYKKCQDETLAAIQRAEKKIFVDNTFTLEWELEPYMKMAAEHAYMVHVITVENRHGGKNSHLIPEDHVKKMAEKYKVVL